MSGDGLRSSVRERRAGKALRHGMKGQAFIAQQNQGGRHHQRRRGLGEILAQRVQRGRHPDCGSGDAGRKLNDGSQKTSDAGGPQEGKREISATAIGAASWGEKSGVTPQNQDETGTTRFKGPAVG